MVKERTLCVSVGWTCVGLLVAGLIYAVYMWKKGRDRKLVLVWICEIAALAAVAFIAFTFPEFYTEKQKRMWTEVRKNGYILTLNGQRPNRWEERKICRKKNRKKYELNDIYDDEKRVDVRPKKKAPIKTVRDPK